MRNVYHNIIIRKEKSMGKENNNSQIILAYVLLNFPQPLYANAERVSRIRP
jgi:hypothetical protein